MQIKYSTKKAKPTKKILTLGKTRQFKAQIYTKLLSLHLREIRTNQTLSYLKKLAKDLDMPTAGEASKGTKRTRPDESGPGNPPKKACDPKGNAAIPKAKEVPIGKRATLPPKTGPAQPTETQARHAEIVKKAQEDQAAKTAQAIKDKATKVAAEAAEAAAKEAAITAEVNAAVAGIPPAGKAIIYTPNNILRLRKYATTDTNQNAPTAHASSMPVLTPEDLLIQADAETDKEGVEVVNTIQLTPNPYTDANNNWCQKGKGGPTKGTRGAREGGKGSRGGQGAKVVPSTTRKVAKKAPQSLLRKKKKK